jgi:hypothetical protein
MEDLPDYRFFNVLCEAVHRNDPHCTEVAVIWDRERLDLGNRDDFCPVGYGPRLGRALRGNEFVQTIELQLGSFLPRPPSDNNDTADLNGVFDFLGRSSTLRTVKLRTSGTGVRLIANSEALLVRTAVCAISQNPHGPLALHLGYAQVEEESHSVNVPLETLAHALRATKSLEELVAWLGNGGSTGLSFGRENEWWYGPPMEDGRTQVARAFRDNCSLKRLQILGGSDAQSVAALVDALHHNGSLITVEYEDFTDTQRRRAQMYCVRNQRVSDVLAELSEPDAEEVSRRKVDWLPILPMFFAVVQHSPRMAASRMLQGLTGLAEELGPTTKSTTKRFGAVE